MPDTNDTRRQLRNVMDEACLALGLPLPEPVTEAELEAIDPTCIDSLSARVEAGLNSLIATKFRFHRSDGPIESALSTAIHRMVKVRRDEQGPTDGDHRVEDCTTVELPEEVVLDLPAVGWYSDDQYVSRDESIDDWHYGYTAKLISVRREASTSGDRMVCVFSVEEV